MRWADTLRLGADHIYSQLANRCKTHRLLSIARLDTLDHAGREITSEDLRAPLDVIDGRLRRVMLMDRVESVRTCTAGNREPPGGRAYKGAAVLSGLTQG